LIERVWRGDDVFGRVARLALAPIEGAYRAVSGTRGWMYDHALLRVTPSPIPTVSVGNLSVGGTGKTPFAAWLAFRLSALGAQPAVVLRGYGGDEPLVHARLNPGIPVVIERRRADGIKRAAELGATVAVLDDAFQHRAASRNIDVALVAAEQWGRSIRVLPAGPWREPLSSLRRAALVVITHKGAEATRLRDIRSAVNEVAPNVPQAVVHFRLADLRTARRGSDEESLPLGALMGLPVVAIAGLADPDAFFRQLTDAGATVKSYAFPDHYRFSVSDISRILDNAGSPEATFVCTLKDAVKLSALWPATAPPLWYVSQALEVEEGSDALEKLLVQLTPTQTQSR
jgi:tetraacyldisaccharide 4'-kinase